MSPSEQKGVDRGVTNVTVPGQSGLNLGGEACPVQPTSSQLPSPRGHFLHDISGVVLLVSENSLAGPDGNQYGCVSHEDRWSEGQPRTPVPSGTLEGCLDRRVFSLPTDSKGQVEAGLRAKDRVQMPHSFQSNPETLGQWLSLALGLSAHLSFNHCASGCVLEDTPALVR